MAVPGMPTNELATSTTKPSRRSARRTWPELSLGFLQLTMEDHLEDMDPGTQGKTYLPKYAAQAI